MGSRANFHKGCSPGTLTKIPATCRERSQQGRQIHQPLGDQMADLPLPLPDAIDAEQSGVQ